METPSPTAVADAAALLRRDPLQPYAPCRRSVKWQPTQRPWKSVP